MGVANIGCHYYCLCKAFGPHDVRCVSVKSSRSYQEPFCSSNGSTCWLQVSKYSVVLDHAVETLALYTTYDSVCLFQQEMCILRLNYTVQHPGNGEGELF